MLRRFLVVALAALAVAGPAHADHATQNLHWPNTVQLVNRYPHEVSSTCPDCRKIRVINRTGWSPSYTGNFALLAAVREVSRMLDWHVTFSVASSAKRIWTRERDELGVQKSWYLSTQQPTASITLYQSPDTPTSAGTTSCSHKHDLRPTGRYMMEPYCQGDVNHIVYGEIVFTCNEFSCRGRDMGPNFIGTIIHEFGHMVGLGDSYILPGCGINGTFTPASVMCVTGPRESGWFTPHDYNITRGVYLGHVDLQP